ncbi:putative transcription factor GRAS family [Lupinus albus]|uniref:Putative transcription factor GRAS family n=1 Tax=Lupinus albus TaxID=3870 RepID=A0A6A4MYQ9_LUPAL|nr:putative transcription factor GRAS family [Lupinus albus]
MFMMGDPHYAENNASFSVMGKDFSATILNYINQMLNDDEDIEKSCMFLDSFALQATEKSFYEVIGVNYPSPFTHHLHNYPTISTPSITTTTNSNESHHISILPMHYNSFPMPTTFPVPLNFLLHSNSTSIKQVMINVESDDGEHKNDDLNGRKNRKREDKREVEEGRINKQSALYVDENELSELFDKVLLGIGLGKVPNVITQQQNEKSYMYGGGKSRGKKQVKNEKVVDLRTLLMLCAQAISSNNHSTAKELLKQIKQHSSSIGDGTQRLAHCFENALEARLAGTGTQIYSILLSSKGASAAEMVRAYQMYDSACPFDKLEIIFALNSIWSVAKEAQTLHIVDFGINYGFKWPALIRRLSQRPGGPPKLRLTGIEIPQPGFRPEEKVHEAGRRLASYCKRFKVPFEYNAIVQKKWETIKIEDLKIMKNEVVAVNCMFRFENLLDETVLVNNPRDAVLDLIRRVNPSIFVHGIVNGCYDAPFFVTRLREALLHYSALFDILDTNVGREDPMRLKFEELFGMEVMNVIGCEGCERVQRPETYKQWQIRNMKIGFRQLPLDHQILHKLKDRLRNDGYHSDFMLEVDKNWVLQGWKGRILRASSCWVPL